MVPTGDLYVMGMNVEQAYFKNLMDKIGVEADIEHMGEYKGAGELTRW
jgi:protease-4